VLAALLTSLYNKSFETMSSS